MRCRNKITPNLHLGFLFLLQIFSLLSFAQIDNPKFSHLTTNDGLSQNTIFAILKDCKGFMWFATDEGLNKYDGYRFKVYKHDPENPGSISDNSVYNVMEDAAQNLWAVSPGGLDRFDRIKETFIHYTSTDKGVVFRNIFQDSKKRIWLGSNKGFCLFDKTNGTFKFYRNKDNDINSLSQNYVTKITEDNSGELWIGTRNGLNRFNPETEKFVRYFNDRSNAKSIGSDFIKSVYKDSKGNIWIGTQGNGIALFNRTDNTFSNYKHDPDNKNSICHNDILSFAEDREERLWIGTENGGISVFDYSKKLFVCYQYDENDPFSISGNSVYSLYKDDIGNMWAGTWSGGINFRPFFGNKFAHFKKIPNNNNSLDNNLVLSIGSDANNNIWIGTDGGGLNRFNPRTHSFMNYRNDKSIPKSMYSDYVLSVSDYLPGVLALGFHRGGIDLFDINKQAFTHYAPGDMSAGRQTSPSVNIVYKDRQNNLWAGINDNDGLYSFDQKTNGFNVFFPYTKNEKNIGGGSVFAMCDTRAGQFWIGGNKGLYLFDRTSKQFTQYQHNPKNKQSLSNDAIYSIMEDGAGNLWLGTAGGLNFFDSKTKTFTAYTEKNGLANNTVWSTQQDRHGNLWIATNKGLSKFNPRTKLFKNYTVNDGLQSFAFKARASYQAPDGEMFFGGVNGFNSFYPDSIKDNDFVPPVRLTDFQVFNKPVEIGANTSLKESISEAREITLDYDQSVFTIEFAALNFNQPERNSYAYKLEGFDKDWINSGNKHSATYTNLNPGTYIFKVKGSNNDGIWNDRGTAIKIIITPPFWLTWWFKALVLLGVLGGILAIYRYRMNIIKAQKENLEQKVEEQTWQLILSARDEKKARQEADNANKAKTVFLATMSHEIRTPMNGVIGMASLLNETELTSEQREYAKTISTCGEALLTVINDILDFSKIESGNMELEYRSFDLRTCIEEVLDVFAGKAGQLGLDLVYEIDHNVPAQIIGDSLRLRQVLINLVSNAIKFTKQGEIFVGVYLAKPKPDGKIELRFDIRDTGIGIPADKMERLFKAFSQVDSSTSRKYGGTGLGLVISEKIIVLMGGGIGVTSKENEGTTFTFTIVTAAGEQVSQAYATTDTAGMENKKILVVDDNLTNRCILKKQLEMWKWIPTIASSGAEALEIMARHMEFDLLLTDMQMPDMDGCELARQVKHLYPQLPVILLSSIGDERNKKYDGLFKSVLAKPIKQEMLYKLIVNELRGELNRSTGLLPMDQKLSIEFAKEHPLKILVAEDNLVNQKLTLKVLSKLGFEASLAENGRIAVDMAGLHQYDIILMDVQMPEIDGLEATRIIRQNIQIQPTIIAMTANAMQEDRKECLDAGMDDFLSKPVKLEEITNMLAKWFYIMKENAISFKTPA
jgi:signal transduction histidine kinase/CheY-like chemotaxis protein/ligand-binding sensor domain-containing protein